MIIPGYELLEEISTNAASITWKARQTALGRVVAIRVLRPEIMSELNPEKFRDEARAAAGLTHAGLVHIHDAGQTPDNVPYFVLEYVDGPTFQQLMIDEGRLNESDVLAMMADVAEALDFAWEKSNIPHLDLTPDSLIRDPIKKTKVMGFGLVRFFGGANVGRDYRYVIGTPNYVAPEQVQGLVDFDVRTDMYSLGAICVHLLTGIVPFYREQPDDIFEKHLRENLPDLYDRNQNLSPGMYWLVEKLLAKDRSHRHADWKEVLRDIKAVQNGRMPESELLAAGQSLLLRSDERPSKAVSAKTAGSGKILVKPAGVNGSGSGSALAVKKMTYKQKSAAPAVAFLLLLVIAAVGFVLVQMKKDVVGEDLSQFPEEPTSIVPPPGERAVVTDITYPPEPKPERPQITFPERQPREPETPMVIETRPREPTRPVVPRYRDFVQATEDELPRNPGIITRPGEGRTRQVNTRPRPQNPPTRPAPANWDVQGYKDAISLLAKAEKNYLDFHRKLVDQKALKEAELTARDAIELLETIRPAAPKSKNIGDTISKANQLIYNIRRSRTD